MHSFTIGGSPITIASLAQLVEHFTCNEDVTGSNPVGGSEWMYQLIQTNRGLFHKIENIPCKRSIRSTARMLPCHGRDESSILS